MIDVSSLLVDEVAVGVDQATLLVLSTLVSVLISWYQDISLVIAIQGAYYIYLVKLTAVDLDCWVHH